MKKSKGGPSVKQHLEHFIDFRKQAIVEVQAITNLRNKHSHLSTDNVNSSIGVGINSSRLSFLLNDELDLHAGKLHQHQCEMKECIESVSKFLSSAEDAASLPIDALALHKVLQDMQQQLLLEMTIAQKLSSYDESTITQDSLVTMTACFNYTPYLSLQELDMIISNM